MDLNGLTITTLTRKRVKVSKFCTRCSQPYQIVVHRDIYERLLRGRLNLQDLEKISAEEIACLNGDDCPACQETRPCDP